MTIKEFVEILKNSELPEDTPIKASGNHEIIRVIFDENRNEIHIWTIPFSILENERVLYTNGEEDV